MTSKELDGLAGAGQRSGRDLKATEDGVKGVGNESQKASKGIKEIATALGLVAIGTAALRTLWQSLDDGIKRFDTLENFPKVLQALGVEAEESTKSTQRLSDGIEGLPTKLDDIASTAQRMYTSFDDMDTATESALALNNALLGSGSSAEQAKRGTEMYLKMLQTGEVDMQTWRSLSETMDVGLVKIAEGFGFAGRTAKDDLYKALQDGTIPMKEFNDKLIEIGTGSGVMAELARENTKGVGTALGNLRNAAARGIAGIIESFDNLSKEVTGKSLADNIEGLKVVVMGAFDTIGNVIESSTPLFKVLAEVIRIVYEVVQKLGPSLLIAASAFLAIQTAIKVATVAMAAYRSTMFAVQAAQLLMATSTTVLSGAMGVASVAARGLGVALKAMMGPVGWVATGIGAVGGAIYGLIKWFNKASEEEKALTEETSALAEETKKLNDELDNSAQAHKDNISDINASAKANEDLMKKVQELADKENKSASDKALLQSYTDKLNESVEGLNLSYSEQADALNMSNDEMADYVRLMQDQEKLEASQERLMEIAKERNKADERLDEINKKREEWNDLLEDGSIKSDEAKEAIEELGTEEAKLKETNGELAEEYQNTQSVIEDLTESIQSNAAQTTEALLKMLEENEDLMNELSEMYSELADNATEAFDRMDDESKYTFDEMLDNLKHNQQMIEEFGENYAYLMEKGSKEGHEGFLLWLEQLGPDSAAELQVLRDASDEELEEFMKVMDGGGETALDAFMERVGDGLDDSVDLIGLFPGSGKKTLIQKLQEAGFADVGEKVGEDINEGVDSITPEVLQKMQGVATSMLGKFGGSYAAYSGIGINMMSGLNSGLWEGSSEVMNTARTIALNAFSTVKHTLGIFSPSRVFRDDIGKMIPEGIAVGIEDNEKAIDHALSNMSDDMMKFSTPEVASGATQMQYASIPANYITNNTYQGKTDADANKTVYVKSVVNMDGETIAEGTWERVNEHINKSKGIEDFF